MAPHEQPQAMEFPSTDEEPLGTIDYDGNYIPPSNDLAPSAVVWHWLTTRCNPVKSVRLIVLGPMQEGTDRCFVVLLFCCFVVVGCTYSCKNIFLSSHPRPLSCLFVLSRNDLPSSGVSLDCQSVAIGKHSRCRGATNSSFQTSTSCFTDCFHL